jgi:hypothetical protein
MARLVLHIGTHKTGTTALQNAFHANRDLLARHGLIYPSFHPHTGHHALLTDYIRLPSAYLHPDGGEAGLKRLAQTWQDKNVTLFLSSEEFSRGGGAGGQVDMARLREVFSGYTEVRVICVLRGQWQFLQSVYLEIARSRIPPAPPTLVELALKDHLIDGLWSDYAKIFTAVRKGFSAAEIEFVAFDRLNRAPGGLIGAMLAFCGIALPKAETEALTQTRANPSPNALATWAAMTIAGGEMPTQMLIDAVQIAFCIEYGPTRASTIFTRSEIAALNRHFAPKNTELFRQQRRRCPPRLELPAQEWITRESIDVNFWVRVARRIHLGSGLPKGTQPEPV